LKLSQKETELSHKESEIEILQVKFLQSEKYRLQVE
jgi:hypothetical protein